MSGDQPTAQVRVQVITGWVMPVVLRSSRNLSSSTASECADLPMSTVAAGWGKEGERIAAMEWMWTLAKWPRPNKIPLMVHVTSPYEN